LLQLCLLNFLNHIKCQLLVSELADRIPEALTLKNEFEELNLPFHDSSVTKSCDPKFFKILIGQEEETVAFNVIFPKIFNTVTKANLTEPVTDFLDGPFID
jgi:hypothetical protein